VIDHAREIKESIDGDKGSIPELTARGRLFGHPGRDRQAALRELDAERAPRLLVDEHRKKPLANQRVERVQDGDEPATGSVGVLRPGRLSRSPPLDATESQLSGIRQTLQAEPTMQGSGEGGDDEGWASN